LIYRINARVTFKLAEVR